MLPTQPHFPGDVVKQCQGEIFIRAHALHVAIEDTVDSVKKAHRIGFSVDQQGAHNGLRHQHEHAAFEAMTGHVTDTNFDLAIVLQDVVVIACSDPPRQHRTARKAIPRISPSHHARWSALPLLRTRIVVSLWHDLKKLYLSFMHVSSIVERGRPRSGHGTVLCPTQLPDVSHTLAANSLIE